MKKIKLRGYLKNAKRMVEITGADFGDYSEWEYYLDDEYWTIADEFIEIMQYIGSKDKNGKERFESDIVKISSDYKTNIITGKITLCKSFEIGEIIFNSEKARYEVNVTKQLESRYDGKMPYTRSLEYTSWTVIGTIYENPELIK